MSVFLTFLQKTAKERGHSLVSRMGDGEEDLETLLPLPLPLPQILDRRTDARSLVRWRHTKFSRLNFLTHGASLARFARWSSAIKKPATKCVMMLQNGCYPHLYCRVTLSWGYYWYCSFLEPYQLVLQVLGETVEKDRCCIIYNTSHARYIE